jgi:glycolate oxidase FAD binding subunit
MAEIFKPDNERQVGEVMQWALTNKAGLDLHGSKAKAGIGNLFKADAGLNLGGLTGVTLYEPEELVMSAKAGTPIRAIEKILAEKNQAFAFEPPDFSSLLGRKTGGTLGGMVGCGFAGPRRIYAGGVRDHVLGVKAVSGRGDVFKTGGRVVKNVTGYDLSKLLTGSWGTLAAMTEITFKVLPRPQTQATLALIGLDNETAMKAMSAALGAPVEVSGAAHIPRARTMLRLEGFEPSVRARLETLKTVLSGFGEMDILYGENSQAVWKKIGNVELVGNEIDNAVWRISTAPANGAKLLAEIEKDLEVMAFFDWGGGLVWVEVIGQKTACAAQIRSAVARFGGHATLVRASEKSRTGNSVFQPQSKIMAALNDRVKQAFDPEDILNPGRMYGRNI